MKKVTIYSTPTCTYCHKAKSFFAEHSVAYEEKDVAGDSAARAEMVQKSGQMGVPVIDIEGTLITGFDEAALRKELAIA